MRIVFCSALFLFVIACSNRNEIPANVIPLKPMQQIVWDVLQADEVAFQRKQSDSTVNLKAASFQLYDTVFSIHKTSREMFYRSYEYYQKHPALYKTLLAGVKKIGEAAKKQQQAPVP